MKPINPELWLAEIEAEHVADEADFQAEQNQLFAKYLDKISTANIPKPDYIYMQISKLKTGGNLDAEEFYDYVKYSDKPSTEDRPLLFFFSDLFEILNDLHVASTESDTSKARENAALKIDELKDRFAEIDLAEINWQPIFDFADGFKEPSSI